MNEIVGALGDAGRAIMDMIADGVREPHERITVGQKLMRVEQLARVGRISEFKQAEKGEPEEKLVGPAQLAAIVAAAEGDDAKGDAGR